MMQVFLIVLSVLTKSLRNERTKTLLGPCYRASDTWSVRERVFDMMCASNRVMIVSIHHRSSSLCICDVCFDLSRLERIVSRVFVYFVCYTTFLSPLFFLISVVFCFLFLLFFSWFSLYVCLKYRWWCLESFLHVVLTFIRSLIADLTFASHRQGKWVGYWHFLTTPCPSYSITLFSHYSPVVSMIKVLSIRIQLPLTVDQFSVAASNFTWKKVCHLSPYLHCTIRISNIHDLDMFLIFYLLSASYVPFWLSLLKIFFNFVFSLSWYFFRQSLSPVITTSYPSNESVFRFLLLSKYS